mgnify:CR=1 FL=1
MCFLMGKDRDPIDIDSINTSSLGSMMNTSTGTVATVENLPIQIMSASSGEYPQANAVSQLQGSLMNRNTDLALAAYEADKAANLKINTNPLPGGRGDAPLSCPLYTSDAADEPPCVDLGGFRIITKQTKIQ